MEERHRELIDTAEERQRELLDTTESILAESDYRRANPGDYKCPHCKYVSLKYRASRCPLCQGTVDEPYWVSVDASKAAARAAEQRARDEATAAKRKEDECKAAFMRSPEYLAKISAEATEAERRRKRATFDNRLTFATKVAGGYIIACVVLLPVVGVVQAVSQWPSPGTDGWIFKVFYDFGFPLACLVVLGKIFIYAFRKLTGT